MKIQISTSREDDNELQAVNGTAQKPREKVNLFWILVAIAILVFGGYQLLSDPIKPIADANGPDDYSLAVITDENIIKQDIGAMNVSIVSGVFNPLNAGVTFKSSNFSGVYRIFLTNFLFNSDFIMDIAGFWVNSGNFRMCIVNDGKIIADVEPGMLVDVALEDLNGSFELVIAGESADFEFTLDRSFCESYGIVKEK